LSRRERSTLKARGMSVFKQFENRTTEKEFEMHTTARRALPASAPRNAARKRHRDAFAR
jgi:hypothetical protein